MIRETASTEKKKFKTLEYPDPKSITKDMTETSIRLKRIKDITGVSCFGLREVGYPVTSRYDGSEALLPHENRTTGISALCCCKVVLSGSSPPQIFVRNEKTPHTDV